MIYTTLKQNQAKGNDYLDIAIYTEECWTIVADLFDNGEKYHNKWDETDFDKLCEDYTDRQIASACLKYLKTRAKDKDGCLMIWNKIFFDLDCIECAYDQIVELIQDGTITGSRQLEEIDGKAKKRGYTIRKEYTYGENNIYHGYEYISNLIYEHFPCYADLNDDYCNNCGNCQ